MSGLASLRGWQHSFFSFLPSYKIHHLLACLLANNEREINSCKVHTYTNVISLLSHYGKKKVHGEKLYWIKKSIKYPEEKKGVGGI